MMHPDDFQTALQQAIRSAIETAESDGRNVDIFMSRTFDQSMNADGFAVKGHLSQSGIDAGVEAGFEAIMQLLASAEQKEAA